MSSPAFLAIDIAASCLIAGAPHAFGFTRAATMPWNDLGWWWLCCDPRKQESFSEAAASGKFGTPSACWSGRGEVRMERLAVAAASQRLCLRRPGADAPLLRGHRRPAVARRLDRGGRVPGVSRAADELQPRLLRHRRRRGAGLLQLRRSRRGGGLPGEEAADVRPYRARRHRCGAARDQAAPRGRQPEGARGRPRLLQVDLCPGSGRAAGRVHRPTRPMPARSPPISARRRTRRCGAGRRATGRSTTTSARIADARSAARRGLPVP